MTRAAKSSLMLAVIFTAGIAAPINQYKVPPVILELIAQFKVNFSCSGWFMSVFAVAGVLFALPAGYMIRRVGIKRAWYTALAALAVGSVWGSFALSPALFMISRFIEGIGLCLISVAAPAAVAAWFPPEKRGRPMGIWATWMAAGNIIMFTLAPHLGGWRHVWLFSAGYAFILLIVIACFFKLPAVSEAPAGQQQSGVPAGIWLLGIVFALYMIVVSAVKTYYPAFLSLRYGMSQAEAGTLSSILMAATMIAAPVSGWLADKSGRHRLYLTVSLGAAAAAILLLFCTGAVLPALVLFGLCCGIVPMGLFAVTAKISPAGFAVTALGQNVGMFAGPVFFSYLTAYFSWQAAAAASAAILCLAAVLSALAGKMSKIDAA